jgi:bacterioferritin-associated ferredoxin
MIVCSCNVFSDHQLRSTLANATQRLRMSQICDYLGSGAQCGRCAHIIKRIMDEMTNGAIGPVDAMRACTLPKQRECWKTFPYERVDQGYRKNFDYPEI